MDMRHCTFGCAITLGASIIAVATAAATRPLPVAMNLRRSLAILPSLPRHELVVGALGYVVPRAHQGLELRKGRVDSTGHGSLLGFFLENLGRELLELAQHGSRDLDHLDLALEFCLEPLQRDGVLRVESREAIDFARGSSVVQHPPQLHR